MRTIKLKQLRNVNVLRLSLVKRPANYRPFRIMKAINEDNDMALDLNKLFGISTEPPSTLTATTEPPAPVLVGVAVRDGGDIAAVTQTLAKYGLMVQQETAQEGGVLLEIQPMPPAVTPVLLGTHVMGIVNIPISDALNRLVPTSVFTDYAQATQTLPGVHRAAALLTSTIREWTDGMDSPLVLATKIAAIAREYAEYVSAMMAMVPPELWILDTPELAKTSTTNTIAAKPDETQEPTGAPLQTEEPATIPADDAAGAPFPVSKSTLDAIHQMGVQLGALMVAINKLDAGMTSISRRVTATENALGSVVISKNTHRDAQPKQSAGTFDNALRFSGFEVV